MAGRPIAWLSILAIAGACAHEDGPDILASAQPWPEADRLFHSDPRWWRIRPSTIHGRPADAFSGYSFKSIILSDER